MERVGIFKCRATISTAATLVINVTIIDGQTEVDIRSALLDTVQPLSGWRMFDNKKAPTEEIVGGQEAEPSDNFFQSMEGSSFFGKACSCPRAPKTDRPGSCSFHI